MKSITDKLEALKKILHRAYHEKENVEVGEQWQLNVMRRIKNLGPIKPIRSYAMLFEQFFWRLTPATCFLILIFTALLLKLDFFPEYDVFTSLICGTEEVTLVQLFEF